MGCYDLLVVERKAWNHELIRRYALCPGRQVVPGDLVSLHGDSEIYEVTHTFNDPDGEFADVASAMNPAFYVRKHWPQGKEFSLCNGEGGEVTHEPV